MQSTARATTAYAYMAMLSLPDHQGKPLSLNQIARFFGVTKAACHFAMHNLIEEGFITRVKSGRTFCYHITEEGALFLNHGVHQ